MTVLRPLVSLLSVLSLCLTLLSAPAYADDAKDKDILTMLKISGQLEASEQVISVMVPQLIQLIKNSEIDNTTNQKERNVGKQRLLQPDVTNVKWRSRNKNLVTNFMVILWEKQELRMTQKSKYANVGNPCQQNKNLLQQNDLLLLGKNV